MLSEPPRLRATRQPTPPNSLANRVEPSSSVKVPVVAYSGQRLQASPVGAGAGAVEPPPPPVAPPPRASAGLTGIARLRAAAATATLLREMDTCFSLLGVRSKSRPDPVEPAIGPWS